MADVTLNNLDFHGCQGSSVSPCTTTTTNTTTNRTSDISSVCIPSTPPLISRHLSIELGPNKRLRQDSSDDTATGGSRSSSSSYRVDSSDCFTSPSARSNGERSTITQPEAEGLRREVALLRARCSELNGTIEKLKSQETQNNQKRFQSVQRTLSTTARLENSYDARLQHAQHAIVVLRRRVADLEAQQDDWQRDSGLLCDGQAATEQRMRELETANETLIEENRSLEFRLSFAESEARQERDGRISESQQVALLSQRLAKFESQHRSPAPTEIKLDYFEDWDDV